jgi:hypothetical protein
MPLSNPRRVAAVVLAFAAALLLAIPATAGAVGTRYPSANAARGFDGGAAGWDSSSSTEGICLPPLLCANVENSFQASGGADGGGFIRSGYLGVVGATAVGGTTTAIWQSPPFSYSGGGGGEPGSLGFTLDRRANVDQLLGVAGNSAEYSVRLVDLSAGGEGVTLIAPTTLAGARSWTNVSSGSINPDSLTIGDEYRIQISSRYTSGTSVLVSGSADYDNVVLSAATGNGGGDGKNGGKGKGSGGHGKGAGTFSSQRLEELLRGATPDTAKLDDGKRLLVRVKCPRKVGRQCRTTVQGLLKKGRPATGRRTVRLRSGKSKLVALRIKPKARERVAKRKRLLVRQKVRAGKATATVFKTRLLIRR